MIFQREILLFPYLFFMCFLEKINAVVYSGAESFIKNHKNLDPSFTIHKVSLTQKGYIQFLRYTTDVPTLTDYTFCIWVRSNNLTYSHPLLSYSKDEKERLIRVWVSPFGSHINLEILEYPILQYPMDMLENQWYHVCQSWSSQQAAWNLYLNGKLKSTGSVPKLKGVPIEGGGDIVVGQEYTDFDKGLDDGIEGDIFGFNFVLSPTSTSLKHTINPIELANFPLRRQFVTNRIKPHLYAERPLNIYQPLTAQRFNFEDRQEKPLINNNNNDDFHITTNLDVPRVRSYFNVENNRHEKGIMDFFSTPSKILPLKTNFLTYKKHNRHSAFRQHPDVQQSNPSSIMNNVDDSLKPLGLLLVELSFNCTYKKGAPLNGNGVLINWTKTPVRVFGGAILKNAAPFCT